MTENSSSLNFGRSVKKKKAMGIWGVSEVRICRHFIA